jgi:hypothetical protein
MGKIRVTKVFSSLMVLFVCCASDGENISSIQPAFIETRSLPTYVRVGETAEILVKANAPNGCYSKLLVKMSASVNRKILIRSTAVYQSSGTCPEVVIEHDTTLYFTPVLEGEYYFQFNESPLPIYLDTLKVNS